ncbi:hypothetical protein A2635_05575 [Candidatus Peribacteria bacterium RIFCSPHIGHO2_01_FULL_51_9]|nr:MAG: hypothetical protein A2635_05575 [Candidatus Peribacteria bacterium RIFCSPHIGHO2_01_FULL_51_9]
MHPLKAVVVGCGRMGAFTSDKTRAGLPLGWLPLSHAEAIHTLLGVELVGVCDAQRSVAEAAAKVWGGQVFTDYRAMLLKLKPDIATIATRTDVRPEILKYVAANGVKAIHAEKPLCRSLSDALDVVETLRTHHVVFSYGTVRRYMDAYKQARAIVHSGDLGKLKQIILSFGEAQIMWTAPHLFDLLVFFSDNAPVKYVQASMNAEHVSKQNGRAEMIDDDPRIQFATIVFENGITGIITAAGGMKTELACEDGTITVGADGSYIETQKKSSTGYFLEPERIIPQPALSGTQSAIAGLRDAIVKGEISGMTMDELETEQRILFAVATSALKNGARIKLEDVDPELIITGKTGNLYA